MVKNIFLFLIASLMAVSLVLGAQGNSGSNQAGQGTGDGIQSNTENQERIQSGNYENSNGEQMQIQNENEFRIRVGDSEASSSLEITREMDQIQNKTKLKTQLSNGQGAEIKVMPNTASERAIERLQLKNCNAENNCTIQLKEVGNGEQVRAAYEVRAQKETRVLGIFKTQMRVEAQIDAETGEIIRAKKPWWAFLASE